jgi:hypothetical protein
MNFVAHSAFHGRCRDAGLPRFRVRAILSVAAGALSTPDQWTVICTECEANMLLAAFQKVGRPPTAILKLKHGRSAQAMAATPAYGRRIKDGCWTDGFAEGSCGDAMASVT